jgi:competence protein ComEA
MFKKLITVIALLCATSAFALDVNQATPAELEAVKGIGPALATKITAERQKSPFKDWQDLVTRVNGVGDRNAVKLSTEGVTVNGAAFAGAPAAAPKAKMAKASKAEKAASATAMDTKPAVVSTMASAPAKMNDKAATMATPAALPASDPAAMSKADKKAAAKKAKEEKKAAKAAAAASATADKAKQ